jgi:hypothetical protein
MAAACGILRLYEQYLVYRMTEDMHVMHVSGKIVEQQPREEKS